MTTRPLHLLFFLALAMGCDDGADGAPGAPGLPGASGLPIDVTTCTVPDPTQPDLVYQYLVLTYANGSKDVTCSVADAAGQASARYFLPQGVVANPGGACIVGKDISGAPTSGGWLFESALGGAISATYDDDGDGLDGYAVTFGTSNCEAFAP